MNIVQIVETLDVGGLEVMALNLAIAHRAAGHQSTIYTIFEPGSMAGAAHAAGVPVIPFRKRRGFSASALVHLARRLRQDRAAIVHTHNTPVHHYGAVAGRLAGAAVVNTRHGLALHSHPRQERYFRGVLPLTDAVVFVCELGRRHYEVKGSAPAGKSHVILNGIPLERFQRVPATPGARGARIRFGSIGRFVKAKAHTDLIDAFALIARDLPGAELSIWGYGELREAAERRIEQLGLTGRAVCRGVAEKPEEVLRTLDVFVLSSISEGLPLVILEAMAAGLPIVSTSVGGVPEVAPLDCAWYAAPGDPASLAGAMREAAGADLAAAGHAAYRHAAERFSIERMQARYEELFRRLLA